MRAFFVLIIANLSQIKTNKKYTNQLHLSSFTQNLKHMNWFCRFLQVDLNPEVSSVGIAALAVLKNLKVFLFKDGEDEEDPLQPLMKQLLQQVELCAQFLPHLEQCMHAYQVDDLFNDEKFYVSIHDQVVQRPRTLQLLQISLSGSTQLHAPVSSATAAGAAAAAVERRRARPLSAFRQTNQAQSLGSLFGHCPRGSAARRTPAVHAGNRTHISSIAAQSGAQLVSQPQKFEPQKHNGQRGLERVRCPLEESGGDSLGHVQQTFFVWFLCAGNIRYILFINKKRL